MPPGYFSTQTDSIVTTVARTMAKIVSSRSAALARWNWLWCIPCEATASALFPPEKLNQMTDTNTRQTVRFNLTPNMPLSEEAKARLARLATMQENGRASCRESVSQLVSSSRADGTLKKKKK